MTATGASGGSFAVAARDQIGDPGKCHDERRGDTNLHVRGEFGPSAFGRFQMQ